MSTPPSAGPIARPRLMLAPPSVTACLSSAGGTISGWMACQAGALNVAPTPRAKVSTSSQRGVTRPAAESPASAPAETSMISCVTSRSRRRSKRSAAAPATTPSTTTGRYVAVCTSATTTGDASSSTMSHAAPTACIQVPMFDTSRAIHSALYTR